MKDSNCNDIDWYDFRHGIGIECGIGVSHELHYDYIGYGSWCPTTEAMWKQIGCNKWPSGNEGDDCKVWAGPLSREGKWDPDDKACIIKCNGAIESTDSDARDYCGNSGSGDGKCEQACGADEACDEKYPGIFYDTNNDGYDDLYCDSSCKAHFCNSGTECTSMAGRTCQYYWSFSSKKATWWWSTTIFPEDGYPVEECFDNHDNDCNGYKDCADSGCAGKTNPNTGVTCCQSDSDCPGYDPNTHLKYYCECDKSGCSIYVIENPSYTCKTKGKCSTSSDCDSSYCCDWNYGGTGECKGIGNITSYGGKSYLCVA
jgi:hypothetical protein